MIDTQISTKPNLSKRFSAFIIDYGIIMTFFFILIHFYGVQNEDGSYSLNGFPALVDILFWCFYTVGVEQLWGATLGNRLLKLKVISIRGNQTELTIGQSFKRHLVDLMDSMWFIGIILLKNTQYNQRLGDIWAKTIVIDTTDATQYFKRFV